MSRSSEPNAPRLFRRALSFYPCLLAVAALVLTTLNLGNHYLWQDEAQTALVAKTILERGLPYGTDGLNYFSQEAGAEYGKDWLWKWHTWLSFYLAAGSFALAGVGTFAARLPFALLGAATILLTWEYLRRHTTRSSAVIGSFLLLTCVPFLILSRQARYYSAAAFFSMLALYAYLRVSKGPRSRGTLFVIASIALFHSHFVYFFALVPAVTCHAILFGERHRRRQVLGLLGLSLAITMPWMIWLGSRYGDKYEEVMGLRAGALKFGELVLDLEHVFSAPALTLLAVLLVASRLLGSRIDDTAETTATTSAGWLLVLFVLSNLVLLAVTSPAAFFRYLAPVIPPLLALVGIALTTPAPAVRRWAPLIVVVAILGQPLGDFGYELTHDYDGPIEGIVEFLREHARPGDAVAITYGDLPLKFYLDDLRVVGGLTGEDLEPALTARWVILRRNTITDGDRAVRDFLTRRLPLGSYRRHLLRHADLPFENRESPAEHRFRTVIRRTGVEILERPPAPPEDRPSRTDAPENENGRLPGEAAVGP
jgi:hypothetical protein